MRLPFFSLEYVTRIYLLRILHRPSKSMAIWHVSNVMNRCRQSNQAQMSPSSHVAAECLTAEIAQDCPNDDRDGNTQPDGDAQQDGIYGNIHPFSPFRRWVYSSAT